ncbi:Adenylate_kinase 3 [Hexamita inflata]|uniref:Adenylate kinase 3 n=1 Tax=Hexamita inflata TaxID=28002 RepID=A0AA86NJ15_9EUKA|nr:Adenylate kinase 3 [Hexamita inflata]CAI9958435.1 Adenylate kinase 3 [Hexamita inflata]
MSVVIHITGNPGSGKGTQSELLISRMNFNHFSVGQLMRDEINAGTELGKQLEIINQGKIAPADITMQCVKKHVTNPAYKRVVLDGFPRTVEQCVAYNEIVGPAHLTLIFEVDDKECMRRLLERSKSSGRSDDTEETMKVRFQQYYEKTAPTIEYVKNNMKYVIIDGRGTVEQVWELVKKAVEDVL